jgi:hypothetical protein
VSFYPIVAVRCRTHILEGLTRQIYGGGSCTRRVQGRRDVLELVSVRIMYNVHIKSSFPLFEVGTIVWRLKCNSPRAANRIDRTRFYRPACEGITLLSPERLKL